MKKEEDNHYRNLQLEAGSQKLEARSWKLEVGSRKYEG
jgi:hypothetical protein